MSLLKTNDTIRSETHIKLNVISKEILAVATKVDNEKFKMFLIRLYDEFKYTAYNDIEVSNKDVKELYKELNKVYDRLNHTFWYAKSIKKHLNNIEKIKVKMLGL